MTIIEDMEYRALISCLNAEILIYQINYYIDKLKLS